MRTNFLTGKCRARAEICGGHEVAGILYRSRLPSGDRPAANDSTVHSMVFRLFAISL